MLSFNTTTSASNFQSASSRYSTSSSQNGSKLFPGHFYPSGLSPRQSEAVERLRPNPRERTIPIQIEKSSLANQKSEDVVPTVQITSPKQSIVPNFVSEQRGLQHQQQPAPQAPSNYRQFVAAPKSPRGYGDYPEITGRPQAAVQVPIQINRAPSPQEKVIPTIVSPHPVYYYDNQEQPIQHIRDEQPNATMETKVTGQGQPKRVGRWTLAQLRQTDGIIPSQAGWNKGDSQKLMTNFGTPRNTNTRVKSENLQEVPEDIANRSHGEVRLQSGTNKYCSQRGMTGFGSGRDVCREGVRVAQNPADLAELPEEKIRMSEGIVRLQAGTNKYDSQKGMTGFGTGRRETTKMVDSKHPEYDHEKPDQSEIPLQSGTNKFASQKGMTGFGTARRETTKMVDSNHPDYSHECSIDQTTIPSQMGSNQYASQKGMTGFGQPRWEVLDPSISWQNRKSQGMVRLQSGTNRFASQAGMIGFGTCRNTTFEAEGGELPYEAMKVSETIIPSQAGWNKGDSQKKMTSFGAPRDVKGKHLKRIWELEYPEEAEVSLDRL
ncbi:Protein CBR-UNC-87 [Caenorhabditis briggsae]|uniref:Protein CBR-UNC-87 n=2 Tax=Caenorhabditis briggsae TaxID=6238 RepID=A0AAE9IZL4_CAEBR|nr:Protein CBR-UNC-87 [Caenorhabditis briggsae]ULU13039.1 hypothetical protein L3Y34_015912 [Caenorhabditis briggsae]CAP31702.1 Protein CBR-UNC-87 [Caenorhabditis briggsae]